MKVVLFCMNPYSFGILEPIMKVLKQRNYQYVWFVREEVIQKFPFKNEYITSNIKEVVDFKSDALFVPGNEVPHFLRGVKVQVFHGFAGEKKGHFRIRKYFDLYLTQGPYFTRKFLQLKSKYKDFEVIETGWPKLDVYGQTLHKFDTDKKDLLNKFNVEKIILFAPTFSPSLTCAPFLEKEIEHLAIHKNYLIIIKFHDLMSSEFIKKYKDIADKTSNILYVDERNIIKYLLISDLMISDTSSVVYEFLLLNKPVITFKTHSKVFKWDNSLTYEKLTEKVKINLEQDPYKKERKEIFNEYHPYSDGKSAERMVDATEDYIKKHGVPESRELPWLRRYKMNKMFGKQ
ncbi:CDP-glycerol glycerophosphotransferase family protein [Polaribacter sp. MSW13]|uniref:CDP-glycerol glycerophosphotransferase family protein n=1 Tax=Polaribacter marinus TaxID=2916838 RepID=A0A9X1VLL3_9FLAO|nr:CDP-glycerol glycerophosphotransferase family protein [Polaribacter marinus]MCI2227782.1 CDP-glycerol glycerophosphotransferase family protein [Polaribacter marinus]